MGVRLLAKPFDPGAETNAFLKQCAGAGAVVSFTGLVRSTAQNPIKTLTLEHYPEMAQTRLEALVIEATTRFSLIRASVIHRFGTMRPGEPIMQVMTLSAHRHDAFAAAEFLMDILKTDAPFWKKETGPDGDAWVTAHEGDDDAAGRWRQ